MRAAGDVGEGFVNRNALHERGEVAEDGNRCIAEPLIVAKVSADEEQLGTELPSHTSRHAAADTERLGLIGRCQNDAATDGNRLAAQGRIQQLLDGGIEGVEVRVEDRRLSLQCVLRLPEPGRLPVEVFLFCSCAGVRSTDRSLSDS